MKYIKKYPINLNIRSSNHLFRTVSTLDENCYVPYLRRKAEKMVFLAFKCTLSTRKIQNFVVCPAVLIKNNTIFIIFQWLMLLRRWMLLFVDFDFWDAISNVVMCCVIICAYYLVNILSELIGIWYNDHKFREQKNNSQENRRKCYIEFEKYDFFMYLLLLLLQN